MKASQLKDDEPVVVAMARTPVGRKNGSLKDWHAATLLGSVFDALVERAGIDKAQVDDVVAGCATQVGECAGNVARTALLMADFPVTVPGVTVQRACGSSQQAAHFADNMIRSGVADIVIAGGVELMSRTQGGNDDTRYGTRSPQKLIDDFALPTMGEAGERIAERWNLSRTQLDELALRSHARAAAAQAAGRFDALIVPLVQPDGTPFSRDEGIRPDTSMEKLASLKTSFRPDGRITAGNASQVSDGASGLLFMKAAKARELGLRPLARLHAQHVTGVSPEIMLTGPIPATQNILARSGLAMKDIDLFEINEAFASVLGSWVQDLAPDMDRVNVNGGSIAMGHPLGSTGARLMAMLIDELERRDARFGLQAMCCGGGLGTATIVERITAG